MLVTSTTRSAMSDVSAFIPRFAVTITSNTKTSVVANSHGGQVRERSSRHITSPGDRNAPSQGKVMMSWRGLYFPSFASETLCVKSRIAHCHDFRSAQVASR